MKAERQNRRCFGAKRGAALLLLILLAALFCGCGRGGDEKQPDVSLDLTPKPLTTEGRRLPLDLNERRAEQDGVKFVYPHICDEGMELMDMAVRSECLEFARKNGGNMSCRVRCNNRGILSITMRSVDENGETAAVSAATFDCDTGKLVPLSGCMGSGDTSYRFSMADSVTQKVTAEGFTVLSYLPPVDDSRLFYVEDKALVLLYRKYEICGAEAGFPEIRFEFSEIERYLGPGALLLRLPFFDR